MNRIVPALCVLAVFCSCPVFAAEEQQQGDLYRREVIRTKFHDAIDSPEVTAQLVQALDEKSSSDTNAMPDYVFAYYAALRGLQAKHDKNLIKKLQYLKEALTMLDEAVERAPDDLEVRFVRFSSLHHFPNLLGIGKKRGRDVDRLAAGLARRDYSVVDRKTQEEMIRFLIKSDRLSAAQLSVLRPLEGDGT